MGKVIVNGVGKIFGRNPVLHEVSFSLASGEFVGLVGPSGGGKSVLLKILGKVIEPSWGTITHEEPGKDPNDEDDDHSLSVGFLFQEGALFDSLTVLENVAFPLQAGVHSRHRRCGRDEAYGRSVEILREVGLSKAADKLPGQLSGGMRRRVGIARALVHHPQLVLLDDPTGGLDPVAAHVIVDLIRELHTRYRPTVVLVSHDIRRLLPSVERILGLFGGRITCDLPPHRLYNEASPDVVAFLATRFDFEAFASHERS